MNLKKVMILRDVVDILTDNEMKITRGGYGYYSSSATDYYVCKSGECVADAFCTTDAQCAGWYGAGSTCSCTQYKG